MASQRMVHTSKIPGNKGITLAQLRRFVADTAPLSPDTVPTGKVSILVGHLIELEAVGPDGGHDHPTSPPPAESQTTMLAVMHDGHADGDTVLMPTPPPDWLQSPVKGHGQAEPGEVVPIANYQLIEVKDNVAHYKYHSGN